MATKKATTKKAAVKKTAAKKSTAKKATAKKAAPDQLKRGRGRPRGSSYITDENCLDALDIISEGDTLMAASYQLGLKYGTLYDRLHKDYPEHLTVAKRMSAEALVEKADSDLDPPNDGRNLEPHQVTLRIARAKQRLWRAERADPDAMSAKKQVEHTTPPGQPMEINNNIAPSEAYRKLIQGE